MQGVFFRVEAKKKAERLGLTGFTKNERDGALIIEAEGEKEKIEQFLEWARVGPAGAYVTNVEVSEGEMKGFAEFKVSPS